MHRGWFLGVGTDKLSGGAAVPSDVGRVAVDTAVAMQEIGTIVASYCRHLVYTRCYWINETKIQ